MMQNIKLSATHHAVTHAALERGDDLQAHREAEGGGRGANDTEKTTRDMTEHLLHVPHSLATLAPFKGYSLAFSPRLGRAALCADPGSWTAVGSPAAVRCVHLIAQHPEPPPAMFAVFVTVRLL